MIKTDSEIEKEIERQIEDMQNWHQRYEIAKVDGDVVMEIMLLANFTNCQTRVLALRWVLGESKEETK